MIFLAIILRGVLGVVRRFSLRLLVFLGVVLVFVVPRMGSAAGGTGELVIFHTNDMHARLMKGDDNGLSIGLAEMAAAVAAVRAKNPDTLWLDAGDTIHGMPRINISNGENIIPLLNEAGIDAMTPGNHDFNYGSAQLEKIARRLKFPVLSANTVRAKNGKTAFKPYKIFKLANGIRVGVFGLTTPECAYKTSPKNVTTLEFLNPVDSARAMIAKLRPKCDVLVALMHMGVDASSEFTSERIAREAPGIDVIVDGHSHTALENGLYVGDTLIVQTGWHEYRLGRVELTLRDHEIISRYATLLDANAVASLAATPNPVIEKTLAEIERANQILLSEVVAHSDRELTGERTILRRRESELGNLCADMIRWRTGADIGVINGGGMRTDLPAGNVTRGDVLAIFPFGNTIRKAEISGRVIREMLEHSVYAVPASFGGFLNVSGMTFTLDPSQPAGSRVSEIFVNGAPLVDDKLYTISATDFTLGGGDDYTMLGDLKIVGEYDTCESALIDYLKEVGLGDISVGRISVVNAAEIDEAA